MVLGVTGCPGSGKSVLAGFIAENGWELVDADDLGHEVVEGNSGVLRELVDTFGADICDSTGKLNRKLLAHRAFADSARTRLLNDIVHPALITCLKSRINEISSKGSNVVVSCALIFEWRIEDLFDCVVCMHAHERLRKKRIMERDGRTSDEIDGLFAAQLPESEKIRKADIVIANNGSIENLKVFGTMLSELPRYADTV